MAARWSVTLGAATALATGLASPAVAIGVTPLTFEKTEKPGASFVIPKVVSTPAIAPKPDVVLLVDTTGSMGPAIANVRANLQDVIDDVRDAQPGAQFAVASYGDQIDGAAALFHVHQNLTDNGAAVQAAVNGLTAGGGGDIAEDWVNALYQVANGAISFRADSSRIVVMVGDSSSHNPSAGHTLGQAAADLKADGARVVAVNVQTDTGNGLNASSANPALHKQVDALLGVTGGELVQSTAGTVSTAILSGLRDLDVTVTQAIDCAAGLSVSFDAASRTQRSGTDVEFAETVTVAGDASQGKTLTCTVDFLLNGELAGGAFRQTITVHVADVTPPVVTVDDKVVEATGPTGAVISYPASATDNVDGQLTPTCTPPSDSVFAVGATTVTCTATDAAGLVGTDTAIMKVVDTTPPVTACTPSVNPGGNTPSSNNPDGFYKLSATDIVDAAAKVILYDAAAPTVEVARFPSGTNIKLVQAPGGTATVKPGTGAVDFKVTLRGDAVIVGVDRFGNTSASKSCLVPPNK